MNRIITLCLSAIFVGLFSGCATVVTNDADLAKTPNGVRIYPPKVYLMVDTTEKKTTLAYLPDYSRAYDVKPLTILAKQDFKIEVEEGQLKSLASNQDTTAILSFVKEAATLAAKAAGVAVSSTVINGTFGLDSGIYQLSDEGVFVPVSVKK
ncbi:hypothetical protein [Methylobacter sp.]|uniref:hypothetical protein n=1 Tax=Methylobacter sp. TaxID=2051955 RepID=UPI00248A4DBC|nr:hypothetical protein [Methylobacter sp.]MDI1279425.1 hypothetical protein [Methylobacter sp.]MDI1360182.1 hypothetical protein [Methylobacter sp.]